MKTIMLFIWAALIHITPLIAGDHDRAVKILMTENNENAYPRWSADGTKILFQSNRTGNWQIYVMDRDGKNERQITHDPYNNNFVEWSPDNSKIVFVSDRDGNEEIYIMNSDGAGLRRLTNNPARDIHPYFSWDGKKILFNSLRDDSTSFEIYRMNPDGSNIERLTYTPEEETCARLSPDGSKIIYLVNQLDGNDEVYVMNSDGTHAVNLSKSMAAEGWPTWSPDGKQILFSSDRDAAVQGNYDSFSVYMMNSDGSNVRRLTYPESPYMDARALISPDGKSLVFNRQTNSNGKNMIGIFMMPMP